MTNTQAVEYRVTRDAANPSRDEDAAMAHKSIGTYASQPAAQTALQQAMRAEVEWLTTGRYVSATSLRRAADTMDGIVSVATWQFESSNAAYQRHSVDKAGVSWSMVRVTR